MEIKPTTEDAVEELSFREAILPPSLQELRPKLGRKAKPQKRFRFYSLYALVSRTDTLQGAWAAVRRNNGAPGVDGMSIEQITATLESEAAFLCEIERSLKEKTYRAQAVRRVYIPKAYGKLRPLGIPPVRESSLATLADVLVLTVRSRLMVLMLRCFRESSRETALAESSGLATLSIPGLVHEYGLGNGRA